jgi:hypothetical protein
VHKWRGVDVWNTFQCFWLFTFPTEKVR